MRLLYVMVLVLAFLLGYSCGAEAAQDTPRFSTEVVKELDCLELKVSPPIMLPLTKHTIRVELRIRRHDHHARWALAWDGGSAGAGSSSQSLHGGMKDPKTQEPIEDDYLHVRELRDKPAAPWTFVAAVFDWQGKLTNRKTADILMPEIE